ncbi:MAG TPA: hypothetical protein VEO54_16025 [Thermoanaerobaculia bacterium]|nr:hypothetical protein [Thermoanaerobaculia bacterium]
MEIFVRFALMSAQLALIFARFALMFVQSALMFVRSALIFALPSRSFAQLMLAVVDSEPRLAARKVKFTAASSQ